MLHKCACSRRRCPSQPVGDKVHEDKVVEGLDETALQHRAPSQLLQVVQRHAAQKLPLPPKDAGRHELREKVGLHFCSCFELDG